MHTISRKPLLEFAKVHADAYTPLDNWYRTAKSAQWQNFAQIKQIYSSVDLVERYTVFNIKGNAYRLIAEINYKKQTIYIRHILTHKEYNKGKWRR